MLWLGRVRARGAAAPADAAAVVVVLDSAVGDAHFALVDFDRVERGRTAFDIRGAALIVRELLQHYTVEGAAQAVSEALAGLDSLAAGAVPRDAARAACRPLVEVFDALLQVTTWARLQAAQDVAEAELRQWVTE